ncbi:MAG TPA: ABC transporter permease [Bryobacteraceae bacterium]|nr:ABC transporter permease [Bryobacteraceae bacterium]
MPWYQRWRNVFRPASLDHDIELELQYHIDETTDRLIASGLPPAEALREARRRLGNYGIQKEKTRDMNIAAWLDNTRSDLRYGLRQLRNNPGFTAVAILSLALGIGANTAMFQLINALHMKSLPVANPQELAYVNFAPGSARGGWWSSRSANMTYTMWEHLRENQQALSSIWAWSAGHFNLSPGGEPRYAEGLFVSGEFFPGLGVQSQLGRLFTAVDDSPSCPTGVVISDAFWRREYAGDPAILSRTVSLNGLPFPVIGVTQPSFFGVEVGSRFDIALPLCADRLLAENKAGRIPNTTAYWLSAMGRLRPGQSVESANAHFQALSPAFMKAIVPPEYDPSFARRFLANKLQATSAATGISGLRERYERPLYLLLAITGLVLLIACANLANLLLARAAARASEIAVRLAIGASRARLIRQSLVESLLLAAMGAAGGAALAVILSRGLLTFLGTSADPVFIDVATDWRVLSFTVALAIFTCLLFGLAPAIRATYVAPGLAIRSEGRGIAGGGNRLRRALVVVQVALSLVLLVGALLFTRSLHNLLNADSGFQAEGIIAMEMDASRAKIVKERRAALYRDITAQLTAIPGVISAAQVRITPVSGSSWDQTIGPDGAPAATSGKESYFNRTAPGYFHTMGTRILAGRDFTERDDLSAPQIAIVNELFARKYFNGANPVGRTFRMNTQAGKPEPLYQIVGMVENTKYHNLREEFKPVAFLPIAQDDSPDSGSNFVLRVGGSPASAIAAAKAIAASVGPTVGVRFRPLPEQMRESVLRERLMATLSGGFGFLAALLATLGIYGVIAYMVVRRRQEIGVRIALGAGRANVIGLVMREALVLLAAGIAIGAMLALWAGKTASALLFGLEPNDVPTYLLAAFLLAVVALLASFLPARRAAGLDPMATLRN